MKDCLTASSYSADISSDFSESRRLGRQSCVPPLVLPETFDSDVEQSVFSGVSFGPKSGFHKKKKGNEKSKMVDHETLQGHKTL